MSFEDLDHFSRGDFLYQRFVGFEEVELRQSLALDPANLLEDAILDLAFVRWNQEKVQLNSVSVAVGVSDGGDFRTDACVDSQLFFQFPFQRGLRFLAGLDLAPGKLPLQRHWLILGALTDQHLGAANDQSCNDLLHQLALTSLSSSMRRIPIGLSN